MEFPLQRFYRIWFTVSDHQVRYRWRYSFALAARFVCGTALVKKLSRSTDFYYKMARRIGGGENNWHAIEKGWSASCFAWWCSRWSQFSHQILIFLVSSTCQTAVDNIKHEKTHRYAMLDIRRDLQIVVGHTGPRDAEYGDFVEEILSKGEGECCYGFVQLAWFTNFYFIILSSGFSTTIRR